MRERSIIVGADEFAESLGDKVKEYEAFINSKTKDIATLSDRKDILEADLKKIRAELTKMRRDLRKAERELDKTQNAARFADLDAS